MIDSIWPTCRTLASCSVALFALAAGCSSDSSNSNGTGGTSGAAGSSAGTAGSNASAGNGASSGAGSSGSPPSNAGAASAGESGAGDAGESAAAGEGGTNVNLGGSAGTDVGGAGTGGSTAGSAGSAAIGGTAGTAGTGAGTGGVGGSAAGTGGSSAGTGGSAGSAAPDPDGAIVTGSARTTAIAGNPGGSANYMNLWSTCPDDQVLVGFKYVAFGDFLSGLQPVCGKLNVQKTTQVQVTVATGSTLVAYGGNAPASMGSTLCPANSVVVGFNGKVDDRIRVLRFTCAPIILQFQDGVASVGLDLDNKVALASIGPVDQGGDFAFTACPDGQLARGALMTESEYNNTTGWIESLALVCGSASFTYPNGATCASANDCDSRHCDGTCKAFTCDAPAGCTCKPFEGKNYAFCPQTADSNHAAAELTCETKAMHLAWVPDSTTEGWLRATSNAAGVTDDEYIGVDDLTVSGTFANKPGNGTPAFSNWGAGDYGTEPNCLNAADCGEVESCVVVRNDGAWNNISCAQTHPFVCSN